MVVRSLRMREPRSSIPRTSTFLLLCQFATDIFCQYLQNKISEKKGGAKRLQQVLKNEGMTT